MNSVFGRSRRSLARGIAAAGVAFGLLGAAVPAFAASPETSPSAVATESAAQGSWVQIPVGNGMELAANRETGGLLIETTWAGLTWDSTIAGFEHLERFGAGWS